MPERNAVEIKSVSKLFGFGEYAVAAVDHVSVAIRENEFFTLLGPSGCGKTTLLRLIAGFEFPSRGEIVLAGENIAAMPPYKRPINTVFQNYALFPHMTVAENIGFGLQMLGRPKAETSARVSEMLKLVRMEHLAGRRTSQISGGQQQRVALARALAPQPKVLLLDEPLSALDYKLRKEMQIELKRLQAETGITFIFVTHDQEEALTMSDRIAVMSSGKILQIGSPHDIYDTPADRFVADFIGETNFLAAKVIAPGEGSATVELAGGLKLNASAGPGLSAGDAATVVVRPEHASLARPNAAIVLPALSGAVSNVVYFGTDTHYHVHLDGGETFIVRSQNRVMRHDPFETGDPVKVVFEPGAARVLRT